MRRDLRPLARFALWDYARGSWAYALLWLLMLAFILAVPGGWLGDPMVAR